MSNDIPEAVVQAIGWTWAKACAMLDHQIRDPDGPDPRDIQIPALLDDYRADCAAGDDLRRAAATPEVQRVVDALLFCPDCDGRGWIERTGMAHDPACDGSCRNCLVPVPIQEPCKLCGGIGRWQGAQP